MRKRTSLSLPVSMVFPCPLKNKDGGTLTSGFRKCRLGDEDGAQPSGFGLAMVQLTRGLSAPGIADRRSLAIAGNFRKENASLGTEVANAARACRPCDYNTFFLLRTGNPLWCSPVRGPLKCRSQGTTRSWRLNSKSRCSPQRVILVYQLVIPKSEAFDFRRQPEYSSDQCPPNNFAMRLFLEGGG